jgi:primosomal protein N' (replication factor Y)
VVAPLKLTRQKVVAKRKSFGEIAEDNPIAKVLVHTPVSYLEDIYDYWIPSELSDQVLPGSVVKIEFGKAIAEGLVLERNNQNLKNLKPIEGIFGWPGIIDLHVIDHLRKVQARFGGDLWSLINSYLPAIPKKFSSDSATLSNLVDHRIELNPNLFNKADLTRLQNEHGLRYSVNQPGGLPLFETLFELIELRSKLGQVLVIASDFREFDYLSTQMLERFGSDLNLYDSRYGKTDRFKQFQKINRDKPKIILGNRSSAFTALRENSSVFVINDGDQSHYEIRSPGWNSRDVTLLRSADTSLFFYSATPSFEIQRLIDLNWVRKLQINSKAETNFFVTEGQDSYIPVIKKALQKGNVLVSVAAKGYANIFLCSKCRNLANCKCGGKLRILSSGSSPSCYLCNEEQKNWRCTFCGESKPYVISKGLDRKAEEIARAIPSAKVLKFLVDHAPKIEDGDNQIFVSSRGCEPLVNYAGLILLDGERLFNQPALRAEESLKQNWFDLLSRVNDGGYVYISLLNNHPLTQQLLLKKESNSTSNNLRKESKLPPFYRFCEVVGEKSALSAFAENLRKNERFIVSGPIATKEEKGKLIIRIDVDHGRDLVEIMQDVVKMQALKGKPLFDYRFDKYEL